jgi:hypothetical protein
MYKRDSEDAGGGSPGRGVGVPTGSPALPTLFRVAASQAFGKHEDIAKIVGEQQGVFERKEKEDDDQDHHPVQPTAF